MQKDQDYGVDRAGNYHKYQGTLTLMRGARRSTSNIHDIYFIVEEQH